MTRILLIYPHDLVRGALRAVLAGEPDLEVAAECSSPPRAVLLARARRPEVAVADCSLGGMGVLELTRRLRRLSPAPRVLAVGPPAPGPLAPSLLAAGASGYVTRDAEPGELLGAVREVARGARYLGAETARELALDAADPVHDPIRRLSPRELAVLMMVSRGQRRSEISSHLSLSPKTVSTYRTRLMRKLGARSDVELTHLSLRYRLIEPEPGRP